jgi:hypothetical protein
LRQVELRWNAMSLRRSPSLLGERKGTRLWNKEGMTFFNTADKVWQKVYNDEELRGVLCTGWEKMVGRVRTKVANEGWIY